MRQGNDPRPPPHLGRGSAPLRRHGRAGDWVSADELRLVLDVGDDIDAQRYKVALGRLVKRGIVEARGNGKHGNADVRREYRLVADSPALPLRDTPEMAKWRIG